MRRDPQRDPPRRHNRAEQRGAQQVYPRNQARLRSNVRPQGTDWDHVAAWYDQLVGEDGSDYHREVILPATLRLLDPQPGQSILDLCCGQGVLLRALLAAQAGLHALLGIDASKQLIEAARRRLGGPHTHSQTRVTLETGDARRLAPAHHGCFDAVACVMAVHDVDDLPALCVSAAAALRADGRVVIVMMHPCFRIPRQSSWAWDFSKKTQFRRLDRYASPLRVPIATRPGRDPKQQTVFFHRSLAELCAALFAAGLQICGLEELYSHRRATSGGRSRGENRAATEFPLFLALVAKRATASAAH